MRVHGAFDDEQRLSQTPGHWYYSVLWRTHTSLWSWRAVRYELNLTFWAGFLSQYHNQKEAIDQPSKAAKHGFQPGKIHGNRDCDWPVLARLGSLWPPLGRSWGLQAKPLTMVTRLPRLQIPSTHLGRVVGGRKKWATPSPLGQHAAWQGSVAIHTPCLIPASPEGWRNERLEWPCLISALFLISGSSQFDGDEQWGEELEGQWVSQRMKLCLSQIHTNYVRINKSTVQAKSLPSPPDHTLIFIYFYLDLKSETYSLHLPGTQMACLSKQWGRRSIIHQHAESLRRSVLHKIYHDNLRASLKWSSTMGWGWGGLIPPSHNYCKIDFCPQSIFYWVSVLVL